MISKEPAKRDNLAISRGARLVIQLVAMILVFAEGFAIAALCNREWREYGFVMAVVAITVCASCLLCFGVLLAWRQSRNASVVRH